jgi:hypothetical protein
MEALVDALNVHVPKAPTLEETGLLSIKMLLRRRWELREERVKALEDGECRVEDKSVPQGWSRHVDHKGAGIDYWFHRPSNKISFGRPVNAEDDVGDIGASLDAREARARQAEKEFAAAAPSIAAVRAWARSQGKGKGDPMSSPAPEVSIGSGVPRRKGSPPGPPPRAVGKGKGKTRL